MLQRHPKILAEGHKSDLARLHRIEQSRKEEDEYNAKIVYGAEIKSKLSKASVK